MQEIEVFLMRLPKAGTTQYLGLASPVESKAKWCLIHPKQSDQLMLETGIHEGLHIAFPDLKEPEVKKAAKLIAQIPWKLGYRRKD